MRLILCFLILIGSLISADAHAQTVSVCMASKHPVHRVAQYVFKQVYQQAGINVIFSAFPNKRSLLRANEGLCTAEAGRVKRVTEIYENLRIVPTPLFNLRSFAFSKKGRGLKIEKWADLRDHSVAIRRGEIYVAEATKEFAPAEMRDYTTLFTLVENERVDVAIGHWVAALDVLSKPTSDFHVERSVVPLHEHPFYHLVHKDSSELNATLNSILIEWQNSGRLKQELELALEKLAKGKI